MSTNLHGKKLEPVDLFKGQLMDLASTDADADELSRRWTHIEATVAADMRGLLKAVDFLARREPQGDDFLTNLAAHIERSSTPENIIAWMTYLEQMTGSWKELHDKMKAPDQNTPFPDVWKLRFFKWDEWKPLALLWYRQMIKGQHDEDGRTRGRAWSDFVKRFQASHGRCMAITLAGYSAHDRAKIMGRAINQTETKRYPLSPKGALSFDAASQRKMQRALLTPQSDSELSRTIVRWLESSRADGRCRRNTLSRRLSSTSYRKTRPRDRNGCLTSRMTWNVISSHTHSAT